MLSLTGRSSRGGTVSLIFAIALIPLLMMVGLAVDFGFYNQAEAQLSMAADAAAMHAVRVAVQVFENTSNALTSQAQGQAAGAAWFAAQLGNVPQAKFINQPAIVVNCSAASNQCEAQIQYSGVIVTNFGRLFPGNWPYYPDWGISGAATAVISTLTYNEFDFLVDDSSSMLIASQPGDIEKLETLTPCSTQATQVARTTGQPLIRTDNPNKPSAYSWYYDPTGAHDNNSNVSPTDAQGVPIPYGYGTFTYKATSGPNQGNPETINDQKLPLNPTGECDPKFYTEALKGGYAQECFYVPGQTTTAMPPVRSTPPMVPPLDPATGLCTATAVGQIGGGTSKQLNQAKQLVTINGVPQAPCAFACHTDQNPNVDPLHDAAAYNDYYGLARANNVTLRFDDVQSALTGPNGVIPALQTYVGNTGTLNPVTVGVYYFNTNFTAAVAAAPPTGSNTSATLLSNAEAIVQGITPPPVSDSADTNMPNAMAQMSAIYTKAGNVGNGSTPALPRKNLFLVTDGLEDFVGATGQRQQGPLDANVLTDCATLKNLGVTIYVVYTTYYPLPNPYYIENDRAYAEPTANSAIYRALASCASIGPNNEPLIAQATGGANITTALNQLLQIALNSPGRLAD